MSETHNHNIKHVLIIGFCSLLIFLACLLANLIQLVNYLTIRLINIDLYRYINSCLQYVIYSQMVVVAEWWSSSTLTIYYADEQSQKLFGKEHGFAISNHRYEVDAVFLWMASVNDGSLGGCKAFGKKELRFVPIIGWTFFFGEYIFLERNWERDSKNIGLGLDKLMAHKQGVSLMFAAEGTRFTPEKYKTSMKFAEDKGLNVHYKHHLLPRVKGFAYSIKHLKETKANCALYNIQLAFDENAENGVTVSNLIRGIPMHGSLYVKRIDMSEVPAQSDEKLSQYLYDLYSEKDRLMEYHKQNKRFPGIEYKCHRKLFPLFLMLTNFIIVGIPFLYLLIKVFTSGNVPLIIFASLFIIIVYIALYFAIRSAKIAKASTYGTIDGQNKSKTTIKDTINSVVNGNSKHRKDD